MLSGPRYFVLASAPQNFTMKTAVLKMYVVLRMLIIDTACMAVTHIQSSGVTSVVPSWRGAWSSHRRTRDSAPAVVIDTRPSKVFLRSASPREGEATWEL